MDKLEVLKKYAELAQHNLFCYSCNYAMTKPKEGFKEEWRQASEECEVLDEIIKEVSQEVPVHEQITFSLSTTEGITAQVDAYVKKHHPNMHAEARSYVKEVLVNEKGLRLYDISKLVECPRTSLSRFVRGDYESVWLTEKILAFKKRLERTVPVNK